MSFHVVNLLYAMSSYRKSKYKSRRTDTWVDTTGEDMFCTACDKPGNGVRGVSQHLAKSRLCSTYFMESPSNKLPPLLRSPSKTAGGSKLVTHVGDDTVVESPSSYPGDSAGFASFPNGSEVHPSCELFVENMNIPNSVY